MSTMRKILVAGVGGQGIVYLTNIMVEAAMRTGTPVHVSEIHGLSQRGGTVTSGIGLGAYCTGFTGTALVDLLIGLEAMEAQRCMPLLHAGSRVVFSSDRIAPHAVNTGVAHYPEADALAAHLAAHCHEVAHVRRFPEGLAPVLHNLHLLGVAATLSGFPFASRVMKDAIAAQVSPGMAERSLRAFELGMMHRTTSTGNGATAGRTTNA